MRYLDRLQPLALLLMRLTLGAIMVAHGSHKVFGGLHHFVPMVAGLGLPRWLGYVSAFTELIGGLLEKLEAKFPGIRIVSRGAGPVEGTVYVKLAPPLN